MSKVVVDAGVCGFKAAVHARKTGPMSVAVSISSGCDMLTAMNSGHEGSMCTIHANGPRDATAQRSPVEISARAWRCGRRNAWRAG